MRNSHLQRSVEESFLCVESGLGDFQGPLCFSLGSPENRAWVMGWMQEIWGWGWGRWYQEVGRVKQGSERSQWSALCATRAPSRLHLQGTMQNTSKNYSLKKEDWESHPPSPVSHWGGLPLGPGTLLHFPDQGQLPGDSWEARALG